MKRRTLVRRMIHVHRLWRRLFMRLLKWFPSRLVSILNAKWVRNMTRRLVV